MNKKLVVLIALLYTSCTCDGPHRGYRVKDIKNGVTSIRFLSEGYKIGDTLSNNMSDNWVIIDTF